MGGDVVSSGDQSVGLRGRVAVVTGAAQGIGRAVAQRFAAEGAAVALLDLDGKRAAETADSLTAASAWQCDVRSRERVADVLQEVHTDMGPVDILVNCAGIWRHTPVLNVTDAEWDEVLGVNLKGTLICAQAVAPGMLGRRSGKIVNIASMAGFGGTANWSAYCASKTAVNSLTLSLAEELKAHNVHVNSVCPGATQTPMTDYIARIEPATAFDRVHRPEEVAQAVLRLVSPFEQTTTGSIVPMKPLDSVLGIALR